MPLPEPWLRGPIPGLDPLLAPVLYAFAQAREDLEKYTAPLTTAQIWATPHGFGSVGFHIRHIAGSVGRLMTYLKQQQLSDSQMAGLPPSIGRARRARSCWPSSTAPLARPK